MPCRLPPARVVIFVHGVNSDGEWYDAAEQGLCEGPQRPAGLPSGAAGAPRRRHRAADPLRVYAGAGPEGFLAPAFR